MEYKLKQNSSFTIKDSNDNTLVNIPEDGSNNLVDISSSQTISGIKLIQRGTALQFGDSSTFIYQQEDGGNPLVVRSSSQLVLRSGNNVVRPFVNNTHDLGSSTYKWKDLYLSGAIKSDTLQNSSGSTFAQFRSNDINFTKDVIANSGTNSLGTSSYPWLNLYLSGNLSDGTNSVSVANIQPKLTAGTGIAISGNVISSTLDGVDYEVVQTLPLIGKKGTIYLVPNGESGTQNIYDEYIYIPGSGESGDEGRFEFIGTTETDLSNYIDLTSNQTITGTKTFTAPLNITFGNSTYKFDDGTFGQLYIGNNNAGIILDGSTTRMRNIAAQSNNTYDIGSSSQKFKDLYLSGNLDFSGAVKVSGTNRYNFTAWNILPYNAQTLGNSSYQFGGLYLTSNGTITDGTNSLKVSDIANKADKVVAQESGEIIEGNLAELDANGNLANSGIASSNVVTLDGAQTISGEKTFTTAPIAKEMRFYSNASSPSGNYLSVANDNGYNAKIRFNSKGIMFYSGNVCPTTPSSGSNPESLGASSYPWNNLYIKSNIDFGDGAIINKDSSNRICLQYNSEDRVKIGSANLNIKGRLDPDSDNTYNIGRDVLRWKDIYLAGKLSDGTNEASVNELVNGIKEDVSSQISLDNESSLTVLRKECSLIKKGSSVKLHIYISGKNESGAQVTGVRFAGNSTITISTSAIADAIKDMNNNAISSSVAGEYGVLVQKWYVGGNPSIQALRVQHSGENKLYLYNSNYSATINNGDTFILIIDEDLAV